MNNLTAHVQAAPAPAQIIQPTAISPITNPDQAYLDATTKIDISQLDFGSMHNSITDGTLTVTFSDPLEKAGPVPTGWATWSSPPESESANPDVLYRDGNTLTLILSAPVTIFGFELEPAPFGTNTFTVDFYNNNILLGGVSRMVDGDAGARLFALSSTSPDLPINRVQINGPSDFAIAQVRYQLEAQEIDPALVLFIILVLILIIALLLFL